MDILDFTPPNDSGEFFAGTPADGCERFYHGRRSTFWIGSRNMVVVQYRLVNDQEVAVLERYAHRMQNVGATLVWSLGVAKRFSLTRKSMLALSYASSGLRGGIYKSLLDDLTILSIPTQSRYPSKTWLSSPLLKTRLEALETEPGLVCAIDL
jgi:hypothetical protein